MAESIRETGRRRARLTAVAVGATSVFGAGAIAAAVYAPAVVQNISTTGTSQAPATGSDGGSLNSGSQRHQRSQQYQGLQPSQGGGAMGTSSGS
ncbi:hypothetical protein [Sinomonas sp. P10A9]|uniref:Uncharacterized protein n=1 Tax=Sinomonas puerhi TaxID=3238584 RepID=A0AB39L721_9MICC